MQIRTPLTSIAQSLFQLILDDPAVIAQKETDLDEAITSIVNLRAPNIDQNSDEFDEKYDEVLNKVRGMYQGKRKFLLMNAQELLNTEQAKQENIPKLVQ